MTTDTLITRQEIADVVKKTLVHECGLTVAPEFLTEETRLVSDTIRLDSMTFIRSVIAMEDALELTFGDEMLMQIGFHTVGDLVNYIYKAYLEEKGAS